MKNKKTQVRKGKRAKTIRNDKDKSIIQNKMLFQKIAENINEIFWCTSPTMDKILYVSPAFDVIWGISRNELYHNPYIWKESIVSSDKETVERFIQKLITTDFANVEYKIVRPDGTIRDIFVKGFRVHNERGEVINLAGIASDMSEFNQVKANLYLNERLSLLGSLAAGILHEINNPLTWVLSNLNYMQKNELNLATEDYKKLLTETIEGVERIQQIASDLRGFIHSDPKKNILLDIHEVLNSVLTITNNAIKHHCELDTKYNLKVPKICGNPTKLHQVFLNCILNATQAIPGGHVNENKITVSTQIEGKYLRVDIIDTGGGIAPENLSKIFNPFFSTKKRGQNSGLGLTISQEIIRSMGGKIEVKSKPDEGTTFSIYLPTDNDG